MASLTRRDFLKVIGIGTAATTAAVALASCSKNNGDTNSEDKTTDNTSDTDKNTVGKTADDNSGTDITVNEGAEEAEYVELTIGNNGNWDTPTCWRANTFNDSYCSKLLFETLGIQNQNNEYIPWACKGWTTDDNGWSYDFELYDYTTDQEGNKITSDDLVWFTLTSKEKALKPNFANIESAEATGEYTFRIKLTSNQVGVIENYLVDSFIVSQKAVEASGDDFATSCCSTSAYTLASFTSGVEMIFEKRSDYWQTNEELIPADTMPRVDKINLIQYSEASQMGNALEAGEIDFALGLQASTAILFQGDPNYSIQEYTKANGIQVFFTGADNRPLASDKYLRQAIAYCIDTDMIINSVYQGFAGQMYDTANEKAYGYLMKWKDEEYYPYDVEKAKECLEKSNYKGESLVILCGSGFKNIAEILISCMEAIGVKSEILTGDGAWVTANRLDGSIYDMFINQVGCVSLAAQWSIRFDPPPVTVQAVMTMSLQSFFILHGYRKATPRRTLMLYITTLRKKCMLTVSLITMF